MSASLPSNQMRSVHSRMSYACNNCQISSEIPQRQRAVLGHAQRHVHVRQAVGPHQVEGAAVVDGLVDGNLYAVDRPLKQMGLRATPSLAGGVLKNHTASNSLQ